MNRRSRLLLLLLLLLILVWLGGRILNGISTYEKPIEHGPSPEAKANEYLAAEHFLNHYGLKVQRANDLRSVEDLPSVGNTLILLGDRRNMTPKQSQHLLEWAAKGGHLIVVAERLWDEQKGSSGDLLLDALGVQQYDSKAFAQQEAEHNAKAALADAAPKQSTPKQSTPDTSANAESDKALSNNDETGELNHYPALTQLYIENEQAPAYISFDTDFHLYDAQNRANAWANSAEATHLLEIYHGNGLVTVLSDSWAWNNRNIGAYDNAWLLWYLSQDSDVTLLYNPDRESLLSLLLRYFPQALLACALLLMAGLWHLVPRQGPLLPSALRQRRQLQEHLSASADFMLRHHGQQLLLQTLQQDIQRRARQRQPSFDRLAVADQWQTLSKLSRLAPSFISQCMRPAPKQRLRAVDFTRQVANLQTLRNAL